MNKDFKRLVDFNESSIHTDTEGDSLETGFTIRFSTDFTSSNDFLGRVGFFFFDRITIIIMMTMMIMIRITREMRMIERVDRDFTTKESWVSIDPNSFEASIVIEEEGVEEEGIPDIIPFEELRVRPEGRIPEVILKKGWSPLIEGEIENDWCLMREKESWG